MDVGFPDNAQTKYGQIFLDYSNHAKRASKNDRYDNEINLPNVLDTNMAVAIEIEMFEYETTKVVYRTSYDDKHDLVLVVNPKKQFVRTVWLNRKDDIHNTLDASKYDIP
jgi:hypothetical protein